MAHFVLPVRRNERRHQPRAAQPGNAGESPALDAVRQSAPALRFAVAWILAGTALIALLARLGASILAR